MPISGIHARVRRARILFVDPNADALFASPSVATGEGFDVELARDGHEAIALAHVLTPSLIVLETQLPRLDGFEVIRRLKASSRTSAIPIVIVSGAEGEAFDERVAASGCSACLIKPCSIRGLLRLADILTMEGRRAEIARESVPLRATAS